jgi:hypothetical protein
VSKVSPAVSVTAEGGLVGDDVIIAVHCPDDATGTITVTVDGVNYTASPDDGRALFQISGLEAGEYVADATYSGDAKYESKSASSSFLIEEE